MSNSVQVINENDYSFEISNMNPYTKYKSNALLSTDKIYMSNKLVDNAIRIEHMKNSVLCTTFFDILVGIPYYFLNIYLGLFSNIFSLFGMHSVNTMKTNKLMIYLCIQFVQIFIRMIHIIMFALYNSKSNPFAFIQNNIAANTTILIVLLIFQIYITFIISTFYSYFPSKKDLGSISFESFI
jgi:hypothetical protein